MPLAMEHSPLTVRPLKARSIADYRTRYAVESRPLGLSETSGAVILPLHRCEDPEFEYGYGGVLDSHGQLVQYSQSADRIGRGYTPDSELPTENKRVVYCGYFNPQWGHFLFESLPRLCFLADKSDCGSIDEYVFVTDLNGKCDLDPRSNFAALFRLLGILPQVRIISRPVRFASVIVPEEPFVLGRRINMAFSRLIEKICQSAITSSAHASPAKLFLGRSSFPKAVKYELGLQRIENHFRAGGYEVVFPEQIPLDRLIAMMDRAEETVTFSGSAAHNLLFAPSGSQTTVIERFPYVNYFQTAIDVLRDLRTVYVDANAFIRPVDVGLGPFIYCENVYFDNYCRLRNLPLLPPQSEAERIKTLRRFLRLYGRDYGSRWQMPEWLAEHTPLMEEALSDTLSHYDLSKADTPLFRLSEAISPCRLAKKLYHIFR